MRGGGEKGLDTHPERRKKVKEIEREDGGVHKERQKPI